MNKKGFFDKYFYNIAFVVVILFFVGYLVFSFCFPSPSQDCNYQDSGCQGDNSKFGQ